MEKEKEITAEQARKIRKNPSTSDTATQNKFNEVKENLFHFIKQEAKKGARQAGYVLKVIFVRQIILFRTIVSAI